MKNKIIPLCILLCLVLTGCGYAITSETEAGGEEGTDGSERDILSGLTMEDGHIYGKLSENLSVDFTNEDLFEEMGEHAVVAAEVIDFDYQKLAESFWKTEVDFQITEEDSDFCANYSDESGNALTHDEIGKYYNYTALFTDFSTQTKNIFLYRFLPHPVGDMGDTAQRFDQDKDLTFLPAADALEKVTSLMTECGIDFETLKLCREEIYSLTKEDLKKTEEWLAEKDFLTDKDGGSLEKGEWTEEDECYYMVLHRGYEGIPIYEENGNVEFECIYNKEGIQYVDIMNPLRFVEETSDRKPLLSAREAMESLIGYCESMATSKERKLLDMYLCYYPVFQKSGIELVPVWYMDIGEGSESELESGSGAEYIDAFLNAITGEWMDEFQ